MRVRKLHALIRRVRVPRSYLIGGIVALVIVLGSLSNQMESARPEADPVDQQTNARTAELLGQRDLFRDVPKPHTPRQALNDAASGLWQAAWKVAGRGWKEGKHTYRTNGEPNLELIEAARQGDVAKMRLWLGKKADANAVDPYRDGYLDTALMCAVHSGNPEAVRLLLPGMTEEGKKARNRGDGTALTIAHSGRSNAATIEEGRRFQEIERLLVEAGVPE